MSGMGTGLMKLAGMTGGLAMTPTTMTLMWTRNSTGGIGEMIQTPLTGNGQMAMISKT